MTLRSLAITLMGMGGSLIEAQKRLPSLPDLDQVAALLNIPGLSDADRNPGAPLHLRQAVLLARIADWAGLCSRAARETGELDLSGVTERYAYLIETLDEDEDRWWQAGGVDDSSGVEDSADGVATYAATDIEGANLAGLQLSRMDFDGVLADAASFRGSQLAYASFRGANLRGACLEGAVLTGADLAGADLAGADVAGVKVSSKEEKAALVWPNPNDKPPARCQLVGLVSSRS